MSSLLVIAAVLVAAGLALRLNAARRTIRDLNGRLATAEVLVGTDPLTGLANRVGLHRALDEAHRDPNEPQMSVLLFDLDRLKRINDEHGHPTGDAVLAEIARRISSAGAPVRCAARLGGDEFVVVLAPTGDTDTAQCAEDYARTLWWNVGAPVVLDDLTLRVTASIGIAVLPRGRVEELLGAADKAMYRAKRTGARICRYHPRLDEAAAATEAPPAQVPQARTPAPRHPDFAAPPAG